MNRATAVKPARSAAADEVFAALRAILAAHVPPLRACADKPGNYQVESATATYKGKPLWMAGVRSGKNYISFHLMAVYAFPELLKGMSPELKRRMQGKACFNFTQVDDKLFAELKQLAKVGISRLGAIDWDAMAAQRREKAKAKKTKRTKARS